MPAPDRLLKLDTSSDLSAQLTECHGGPVNACAFGPRLSWAVSGGWDGHLLQWDPATGQATDRWVASLRPITAVAASADGTMILAGDMDGRVSMWDALSHVQQKVESVHTRPIGGLAISGNGKAYASAGWDGAVHAWVKHDEEQPAQHLVLRGHQDLVAGCKFWPDGRWLLSWGQDGAAILWDLAFGNPYQNWNAGGRRFTSMDVAPDATLMAAGTADGMAYLWNLHDSHHPPVRWQDEKPVKAVLFSPNARELIVVNAGGAVNCLSVPEMYPTCPPKQIGHEVHCAALAPTGECLAVGADDGSVIFLPLPHLDRCEVILTPLERIEEHTETGLWGKLRKKTKLVKMRRASCPKCGRLLELPGDGIPIPRPCPGCQRHLAFTPFCLAG